MATVEAQIYYPKHTSIWENIAGTIIIVQTNIDHCSKVFTTGQARVNHCITHHRSLTLLTRDW